MMIVNVLISLIVLTNHCVHNKVINVNVNNGNNSTECCVNGMCACSSLYTALWNITNNTIINITSERVALLNNATMGSNKLTNITITGNNVIVMCNNSGSVYCESCDHVSIEGITWDSCGDPDIAGVTFNVTSNISLVNCTFQHSQSQAVSLLEVLDNVLIQSCKFLLNYNALSINRDPLGFSSSSSIIVTIVESYFYRNGHMQNVSFDSPQTLYIDIDDNSIMDCDIVFNKTKFISNGNAAYMNVRVFRLINIQFIEIVLFNSSFYNGYAGSGIDILFSSDNGDMVLSIMSSNFSNNEGSSVWCLSFGNKISISINDSNFSYTRPAVGSYVGMSALGIFPQANNVSEITFCGVTI